MVFRELELVKDEPGAAAAVVVESLPTFIEAAGRHPRSLVILQADAPVSPAELRRYCLALGGVREYQEAGEIRTVKNDPTIPNSTAMSLKALPLHSDGTFLAQPPARFMLSFVRADGAGGGLSTLMPMSAILAAAPERVLEALLTADYLFPRGYDGDLTDSHVGPVLYPEGAGLHIRWRSDDIWRPRVIQAHGTDAAGAVDWLHDFLQETPSFAYPAEAGQTLLIPNTVMLHGRTELSADSPREVLRVWVVGK